MAKRKKVRMAGTPETGYLVEAAIYTPPHPNDGPRVRAEKCRVSSLFRQTMNDLTARRRLEFLIAMNFVLTDLFLTLTYRDADLPYTRKEAREKIAKFLTALRLWRKKQGLTLKYIYVIEHKHGDGRFHHHIIINATERDMETIRALWIYGDVCDMEYLGSREYEDWAGYMTKEGIEGRPVGERMWIPSTNLKKPIERTTYVSDDETLDFPAVAGVVRLASKEATERDANFHYIKYRIPPRYNQREPSHERRAWEPEGPPLLSDLKGGITFRQGRRK